MDQSTIRPSWREAHPVSPASVLLGAFVASAVLITGIITTHPQVSLLYVTFTASSILGAASVLLTRYGNRGAAVGVAIVAGIATTIFTIFLGEQLLPVLRAIGL